MSNLNKTIAMLAKGESFYTEGYEDKMTLNDTMDIYNSLPVINSKMKFPASEVPVARFEEGTAPMTFGVSANLLGVYMETNEIKDIKQALNNIAESYRIPAEELGVVFESVDTIRKIVGECKCESDPMVRKAKMKSTAHIGYVIKGMQNNGVCCCKEPSSHIEYNFKDETNLVNIERSSGSFGDGYNDAKRSFYDG